MNKVTNPSGERMDGERVEAVAIPKWFAQIAAWTCGIFVALFIPWGAWVSSNLITIGVKVDSTAALTTQLNDMQQKLTAHVSDTEIHAGLVRRVESLERKAESNEQRIRAVEVDRNQTTTRPSTP